MTKQGEKIQAWADRAGITPRDYTGTFHAAADAMGIPPGPTDARMVTYLQRLTGSDETNLMNLEALAAKQRGADHWGALGLEVGDTWFYEFDGSTMYATIPDWTPRGLPFSVSVEAIPLTIDDTRYMVSDNAAATAYLRMLAVGSNFMRWRDSSNNLTQRSAGSPTSVGQASKSSFRAYEDVIEGEWGGTTTGFSATPIGPLYNVYKRIGGYGVGGFFHGPIWNVSLHDGSPIQNTYVCYGNGARYVQLENPIVLEGDFEIEFDWIRQDRTGTGFYTPMGYSQAPATLSILIGDSGYVEPDSFALRTVVSDRKWLNALADVAQGQHCRIKVTRSGTTHTLYVDGVSKGDVTGVVYDVGVDTIGAAQNGNYKTPANSALQNVIIRDLDNDLEWRYNLDEGAGTDALNTGNTAGGATSYDGAWVPDTDWQFIEDNTRFYPMGDNDATLKCYDGTGQRKPSADGTIVNHNPANWS